MSGHTPGPWRYDANEGSLRECLTGNYVAQLEQPSTADAKLITAAPDLLEALQAMLVTHDAEHPDADYAQFKAREALTKAGVL